MSLVKISQNNWSDPVQVWASCRHSIRNGEVIYCKLKASNHETYENNRAITKRGESPRKRIMEHKNVPNTAYLK